MLQGDFLASTDYDSYGSVKSTIILELELERGILIVELRIKKVNKVLRKIKLVRQLDKDDILIEVQKCTDDLATN